MAYNGSGVFSRLYSWATDAANGVKISSTRMDAELDGIATALSTALLKDGQQTPTANIPMATFKFTGLGAGSAATDSAQYQQTYTINPSSPGTVNNVVIGGVTPLAGTFANLTCTQVSLTSGQVLFPATQVPTAHPNTLDDYEEGTFTPTMGDGTNNYTLSVALGNYTKIGNIVRASFAATWTGLGSAGSSQLRVGALPFTSGGASGSRYATALGNIDGMDNATGKQIIANTTDGATVILFYQVNDNAAPSNVAADANHTAGSVTGTIIYIV